MGLQNKKDLSRLSPEELGAVDNYIQYLGFKFGKENIFDDNSLYVKTRKYVAYDCDRWKN